jgi:hypothetical protein
MENPLHIAGQIPDGEVDLGQGDAQDGHLPILLWPPFSAPNPGSE